MVTIYCAYTEAINPSGATPVLTPAQVWKGLERKVLRPQDFVPAIKGCDVLEQKDNEVTRLVHFGPRGPMPAEDMKEVCKSYAPSVVDFHQPWGTKISNIVSNGPSLEETDLYLTYTFEWRVPDVTEGSEEHKKITAEKVAQAKGAVKKSIESFRQFATAGELN